jgi:hypothetical protein
MPRLFPSVQFQFVREPRERAVLSGLVLSGGGRMILQLDMGSARPWRIHGRRVGVTYVARHRGVATVNARWRRVKRGWIGIWLENGREYVFAFHLRQARDGDSIELDPAEEFYNLDPEELAKLPIRLVVPKAVLAESEGRLARYYAQWLDRTLAAAREHFGS